MGLFDELIPYLDDRHGLLKDTIEAIHPSGNSMSLASDATFFLPFLDTEDQALIKNLWLYHFDKLKVNKGLINRKPDAKDRQAHDDYMKLVMASHIMKTTHALNVYVEGKKNWWNFDNVAPTEGNKFKVIWSILSNRAYFWHARLAGVIPHYKHAIELPLSFLDNLLWTGSSAITLLFNPKNTSAILLDFSKYVTAGINGETIYTRVVRALILRRLRITYDSKMSNVYSIYYGVNHPFTKRMRILESQMPIL